MYTFFAFPTETKADPRGEDDQGGEPAALPRTGFAPGRTTPLAALGGSARLYTPFQNRLRIEIPKIRVNTEIVGIPMEKGQGDVSWLWDQVGYLEGTASPTLSGNTGLSAHAHLPSGETSAFSNLNQLTWGDEIRILFEGYEYVYAVRHRSYVRPGDLSFLQSKDQD
jgi:LPXTG-site transpeptidase (sortase) family protein